MSCQGVAALGTSVDGSLPPDVEQTDAERAAITAVEWGWYECEPPGRDRLVAPLACPTPFQLVSHSWAIALLRGHVLDVAHLGPMDRKGDSNFAQGCPSESIKM